MEVVEEPVAHNSVVGDVVGVNMSDETPGIDDDAGKCPQSNGVAEATTDTTVDSELAAGSGPAENPVPVESTEHHQVVSVVTTKVHETITIETVVTNVEPGPDTIIAAEETDDHQDIQNQPDNGLASKIADEITELFDENTENATQNELNQAKESLINELDTEPMDTVTFKTEVLVERNDNDGHESGQGDAKPEELDASKKMLNDLHQNLGLSDVLQSDSPDNMENNNSSNREEVLNKEELLDILEGNDVEQADDQFVKIMQSDHANIKTIEAQLALQQLTRLKSKPRRPLDKSIRKKKNETRLSQNNSGAEIKSKKDKKTSDTSGVDDGEVISDDSKGRKEKRNSKKSEISLSGNKSNLKEKNTPDLEAVSTEINIIKEKQAIDSSTDNVESFSSETKPKRSRKVLDNATKALESSGAESKKKREYRKLSNSNDAEINENDQDIEMEIKKSSNVKENIVNALVRDWEDDEHESFKDDAAEKLLEETEGVVKSVEQLVTEQEVAGEQEHIDGSSMDSTTSGVSEGQALNKTGDEGQPQRRLGRVIKKKVIFDPDNPDTFTKGKLVTKTKETVKTDSEKELTTPKKTKVDIQHQQIPKSKSPTGKLQWKKPTPKASKQNKRLTEIDRLLMDEGAVNMIYQLTPEAPKGKKNMRTKAEFIKKIQSSTPDSKEMKFRERKKEIIKSEDGEAKKIVGGKQRSSLSSSVKSISVGEDFEAHSADDSIIYRRHSSSSYSSNCMSPLRTNEESSAGASAARDSRQPSDNPNISNADEESVDQISDVFMSEINTTSPSEVINKSDCLSIKQKLNSKLSHVLNKRKRENVKTDKPAKQKKLSAKHDDKISLVKREDDLVLDNIKTLTVSFDNNLAEICVRRKGEHYNIQTLKDLEQALVYVDSREDVTVTLLTSECGTLCSSLDLRPILNENLETRTINAFGLAESVRSLLSTVERHSKVLCTGAWGACWGLGLALAALSDVALGSERARFALDAGAPLALAAAALAAHTRLPRSTVDNLVLFGREFSAQEALSGGLLSRVLWPERVPAQLRDAAGDLARQPARSLLLKKQLLTLNRNEKTFQSYLEAERNLVVDYWTSSEGQDALRASLQA